MSGANDGIHPAVHIVAPPSDTSTESSSHDNKTVTQLKRLQSASMSMVKHVNCGQKLKRLLRDAKSMGNKAIEICVTLLALYIIVALNNIPKECDTMGPCLQIFIDAGGDVEPDFPFASCGQMHRACELSFMSDLTDPQDEVTAQLAVELSPFVDFCNCIQENSGKVFCTFYISTFCFLLFGLLIIYFAEVTDEEDNEDAITTQNRSPRRLAHIFNILYFAIALIFYSTLVGCSGSDFLEAQRVVVFLSAACLIIAVVVFFIEELGYCLNRDLYQPNAVHAKASPETADSVFDTKIV